MYFPIDQWINVQIKFSIDFKIHKNRFKCDLKFEWKTILQIIWCTIFLWINKNKREKLILPKHKTVFVDIHDAARGRVSNIFLYKIIISSNESSMRRNVGICIILEPHKVVTYIHLKWSGSLEKLNIELHIIWLLQNVRHWHIHNMCIKVANYVRGKCVNISLNFICHVHLKFQMFIVITAAPSSSQDIRIQRMHVVLHELKNFIVFHYAITILNMHIRIHIESVELRCRLRFGW